MKVLKYTAIVLIISLVINQAESNLLDKIKGGIRKLKEHVHTAFCGHKTTTSLPPITTWEPPTTTVDPNEAPDIDVRSNFPVSKREVKEKDMIFFPKDSDEDVIAPAAPPAAAPVKTAFKVDDRVFVDAPDRCPDGKILVRNRCRTFV